MERIENKILLIRGQKVMIDKDLAELYGVRTKVLNQAVRRNVERFPEDFMFRLTKQEKDQLVTICDQFNSLKHSTSKPYAFTEQGVAMLSSVLKSKRAVMVNVQIMRAFTKFRRFLASHDEIARQLKDLKSKYKKHDVEISVIFDAIRKMINYEEKPKNKMGFEV